MRTFPPYRTAQTAIFVSNTCVQVPSYYPPLPKDALPTMTTKIVFETNERIIYPTSVQRYTSTRLCSCNSTPRNFSFLLRKHLQQHVNSSSGSSSTTMASNSWSPIPRSVQQRNTCFTVSKSGNVKYDPNKLQTAKLINPNRSPQALQFPMSNQGVIAA